MSQTYDTTVTVIVRTEGTDEEDAKRNARFQVERRMRNYGIVLEVTELVAVERQSFSDLDIERQQREHDEEEEEDRRRQRPEIEADIAAVRALLGQNSQFEPGGEAAAYRLLKLEADLYAQLEALEEEHQQ